MAEEKNNLSNSVDGPGSNSEPRMEDEGLENKSFDSKDVLSQIDEEGGLQVAEMPESSELQLRRQEAKKQAMRELNSNENAEGDGMFNENEEGGLMDLLREANLSTRHLKFCCGGVVVLLLLVGLVFGGKAAWNWWKDRPQEEEPEEPMIDEPVEEPDDYSFLDPSIMSGIMVGEDQAEEDDATSTGEDLGDQDYEDTFTQQIDDFARIYSALQTDVNELLNKSSDRYDALKDFENELGYLKYLAEQNLEDLVVESENLVGKFNAVEEAKDEAEAQFFEKLQDLDAPAATGMLDVFVAHAEDVVRLRAEFSAREKLISYYEEALEVLEVRIRDISLNEEALIKGVQVVEVEGSNLNLIIDEDSL
jgi:hypothetical protein